MSRALPLMRIAAWVVASAVASLYAFLTAFTRFSPWDDEGDLLLSVKRYLDGLPLYEAAYTQYGPFYYLVRKVLFGIVGAPVTHDATRLLTIGHWLAAAGLCAWCVYRITKSGSWALAGFLAATAHCSSFVAEAGHPQELAVLLLAASAATAAACPGVTPGLCLLGVLAAFALLTKVNVGVLALAALAIAWLSLTRPSRATRLLLAAASVAAVFLPFLLMSTHLGSWSSPYATVASLAIASACLWASLPGDWMRLRPRQLLAAAAAAAAAVAGVCAATVWLGDSIGGLVSGVVLRPMQRAYTIPFRISPSAVAVAACSAALATLLFALTRSGRLPQQTLDRVADVGKAGLGVVGLWILADDPGCAVAYVGPFLWVALLPPPPGAPRFERRHATVVIALLAVLQLLVAYPVAGTQRYWATFLLVPVLVPCLADTWTLATGRLRRSWALLAEGALLAVIVGLGLSALAVREPLRAYRAGTPAGLRGFHLARLPEDTVRTQQWLSAMVAEHCDALVTLPGFNSLYLWANTDPPTGYNAGNWMMLLKADEQRAVAHALSRHPRACAVRSNAGLEFWLQGVPYVRLPLVEYVRKEFRTVEQRGPYEFMIRNERAWEPSAASAD